MTSAHSGGDAAARTSSALPKFESYAAHGTPAFMVQSRVQFQGIAVLVFGR
jgi:hypothetical protein